MALPPAKDTDTKYTFPHTVRVDRFQTSCHCQSDQQMSQFGRDSSTHVRLSLREKWQGGWYGVRVLRLKPVSVRRSGIKEWRSNAEIYLWSNWDCDWISQIRIFYESGGKVNFDNVR